MMAQGFASRTMISNPLRYSSRSARSLRRESLRLRLVSWLLQAKCLGQAETPADWRPRTTAAPMRPVSSGSSEKYSKLRPQRGFRWRFMPGASSISTSKPFISCPTR